MALITELFRAYTSYTNAFPERTTSESRAKARAIESAIYKDAVSKVCNIRTANPNPDADCASIQEDYYQRCNDRIEEHNHLAKPVDPKPSPDPNHSSQKPQEPSQTIGPFTNCTHHTRGLFSTIYKTATGSLTLALKLTTPSQCTPPHDPKREARLLRTAAHPSIIPLLSTHTLSSSYLLVFPFQPLDLDTLLHNLNPNQPLSKPHSRSIIHNLFSALAHLHSLGIIHRDVKPSNILLASPHGPAYLADFGIAWSPSDAASEPAEEKITDVGTTCYRAPELLFGQKAYDCTLDIWAAGCVVAEIVHSTITVTTTTSSQQGWTLFTAGALGSELALIKSIFETLGTPTNETWPEARNLPDWNKMSFVQFPVKSWKEILPGAERRERELVEGLVRYQSSERISAREVLEWEWEG